MAVERPPARRQRWEVRVTEEEQARLRRAMDTAGIWAEAEGVRVAVAHWCTWMERRAERKSS
ncbi:MAG TPA: hypothetical protein VJJ46_05315 [Anaerolineales bacterium]|nr:hypothetical protein [Anaerolineales bacterium]